LIVSVIIVFSLKNNINKLYKKNIKNNIRYFI